VRRILFAAALAVTACQSAPPPAAFTPEQISVLRDNGFEQVGDAWELAFSNKLLFPFDQSALADGQAENIGTMTGALLGVGVHGAKVVGHTDSDGPAEYNDELSLQRALAVKSAMIAAGMKSGSIEAEGAGERYPVETNDTALGRQENRRVVVIVTSIDAS